MKNSENKSLSGDVKGSFKSRQFRIGTYSIAATLVVIAIVVVVNVLFSKIPQAYTKLDLSSAELYNLSEQTKQIVGGLDTTLDVYWLTQTGTEDNVLSHILDKYNALSNNFNLKKIDPVLNPKFAEDYTSDTIYNNSLVIVNGDRHAFVSYYDIYVYDLSTYQYDGQYTVDFDGENAITRAIDFVTSDSLPTLYTLTGHGEAALSETLSTAITKQNILLGELNLISAGGVPTDAGCILINGISNDISNLEKSMLLSYLEDGGRLLLMSDFIAADLPNLKELLAHYGTAPRGGLIVEGDSNHSILNPTFLLPDLSEHEITAPLTARSYMVVSPLSHPITILDNARDTVSVTGLLTTSELAYEKAAATQTESFDLEEGDTMGPFSVAVAVTDNSGAENEARIVWFGTKLLLADTANEIVSGGNQDIFINSIGWLCDKESSISIHSKSLSSEHLIASDATVNQLSILFIGLVPLIFVAMGVVVLVRRRRK